MFFIIYDLGQKSKAGKFGNFILFLALGLGMLGFLISSSFINMFRSQILYWMLLFGVCASVVMIRTYSESSELVKGLKSTSINPDKFDDTH